MLMNEKIDAGQILEQQRVRVRAEETTGELSKRLAEVGAGLLLSTLNLIERDGVMPKDQNPEEITFAPKITPEIRLIDWTSDAVRIGRLVRGLSPSPGSYSSFRAKRVGLLRAVALPGGTGGSPGRVVADVNRLLVETGKGILWIKEIQPEGKKPMSGKAFLNGYKPEPGERMG
jgi:methionyl-tRNA formyltransferase